MEREAPTPHAAVGVNARVDANLLFAPPLATRAAGTVLLRGDCSRDRGVVKGGVSDADRGGQRPVQIIIASLPALWDIHIGTIQGGSGRTTEQP